MGFEPGTSGANPSVTSRLSLVLNMAWGVRDDLPNTGVFMAMQSLATVYNHLFSNCLDAVFFSEINTVFDAPPAF